MNLIEISSLSKTYPGTKALKEIDLTLESGHIIGLLGPNGSGKTTMMKILTGIIRDYEGQVLIQGQPISEKTKALVSYLPDCSYFSPWMRPVDIMEMFRDFYQDFSTEKFHSMLKSLGLNEKQRIRTMSKGMVEKLQLCLVMSRDAHLYVLDEPIGGVDPAARDYILDTILSNYNENSTILMSTHLIADVEKIFDTVIFLKEGSVVLHGEIDDIRAREGKSIDELFREVFRC